MEYLRRAIAFGRSPPKAVCPATAPNQTYPTSRALDSPDKLENLNVHIFTGDDGRSVEISSSRVQSLAYPDPVLSDLSQMTRDMPDQDCRLVLLAADGRSEQCAARITAPSTGPVLEPLEDGCLLSLEELCDVSPVLNRGESSTSPGVVQFM